MVVVHLEGEAKNTLIKYKKINVNKHTWVSASGLSISVKSENSSVMIG
jgi:hypothetical protein